MSDLKIIEKQLLEKLFKIDGYVLDFTNAKFADFFKVEMNINIYSRKYLFNWDSKAKVLRAFWEIENNKLVAKSIFKLLEYVENKILIWDYDRKDYPKVQVDAVEKIAKRLSGEKIDLIDEIKTSYKENNSEDDFLKKEFDKINIQKLGFDSVITSILEQRISEIQKNLKSKSSLSAIFLLWSTLEWILFWIASKNFRKFNTAESAPKKDWKVLNFNDWTLSNYIDVSKEVGFIWDDVKKFSHALRDFRNYIHPYHQMSQNFYPDERTAIICWKVLETAIYQISNNI